MASDVMKDLERQVIFWPTEPLWAKRRMIGCVVNRRFLFRNMILHARHAGSRVDASWYVRCFRSENGKDIPAPLGVKATREKLGGKDEAAGTEESEWWQVG